MCEDMGGGGMEGQEIRKIRKIETLEICAQKLHLLCESYSSSTVILVIKTSISAFNQVVLIEFTA